MRPSVRIIHLICPNELHVEQLGNGRYSTGIWVVGKQAADDADLIALHKSRSDRSYLQGRKTSWTNERRDPGSAHAEGRRFYFEEDGPPVNWPERGGAGEKAYTYR